MENRGAILMGIAYLALLVFIMVFCAWVTTTFDDFAKYWALFGTIVGVASGSIPAYFFKTQADRSEKRAEEEGERADREAQKAQLFAAAANVPEVREIQREHAELFRS
ncbi:MAG TPA: hypothetical protein VE617_11435 [Propionibacteriaceae bacterium]|jgi:hypothetical protein|nr:hypothetical protein [Propionibacteriaceae bacterium]